MTPISDAPAYAYRLLRALTTGELEDGLRVSHLLDGRPLRTQAEIKKALRLLEDDGYIAIRDKGRGRRPARIFLRAG